MTSLLQPIVPRQEISMVMTLAQAARELGLAPTTLREQIRRGRIAAIKPGHDWLVDEAEVERYRRESLGQAGRPPNILDQRPPFEDVLGKPDEPNILDKRRR